MRIFKVLSFLFVLLFSACQEVVDINLGKAPDKYVIEANITNNEGEASVLISKSTSFEASGKFQGISGASVVIWGDGLPPTTLTETAKGVYTHPFLKGTPNHTYRLTITIDGHTFTSSCQMPVLVKLDSVYLQEITFFNGVEKNIYVKFDDPKGVKNYYRIKEYINGEYTKQINVLKDDLFDGNTVRQILRGKRADRKKNKELKIGDKILILFQTISEPVYKYWYSAERGGVQITGNNNNGAPVNPISNIIGGALGYFSAHTQQTKEYIIEN